MECDDKLLRIPLCFFFLIEEAVGTSFFGRNYGSTVLVHSHFEIIIVIVFLKFVEAQSCFTNHQLVYKYAQVFSFS